MRVFFDSSLNIIGVFPDDEVVVIPGSCELFVPEIKTKLEKPFSFVRQKKNTSGQLLFRKADGSETPDFANEGNLNAPVMEEVQTSRQVSLKEGAHNWTLDEVLAEKYRILAKGKSFRYEEFLNDSAVDKGASIVNTGLNAVSVPPQGVLQLNAIQLSKAVKRFNLYIEGADGLHIEYSVDGQNFDSVDTVSSLFESATTEVKLSKANDTFVFRFTNLNEDGPSIPVRAVAIFF